VNCLGRYAFTRQQPGTGLRALRDPSTPDVDEP